jgi:hypothetical protein
VREREGQKISEMVMKEMCPLAEYPRSDSRWKKIQIQIVLKKNRNSSQLILNKIILPFQDADQSENLHHHYGVARILSISLKHCSYLTSNVSQILTIS